MIATNDTRDGRTQERASIATRWKDGRKRTNDSKIARVKSKREAKTNRTNENLRSTDDQIVSIASITTPEEQRNTNSVGQNKTYKKLVA